jgi:hypothetical protein
MENDNKEDEKVKEIAKSIRQEEDRKRGGSVSEELSGACWLTYAMGDRHCFSGFDAAGCDRLGIQSKLPSTFLPGQSCP